MSSSARNELPPPVADRDEDGATLCGAVATRGSSSDPANNGPNADKLMDPPRSLPDPYGWMRSDDR